MTPFKRDMEIELSGQKFLLRGNFACLREIQSRLNKPISQIIHEIMEQNLPIELFPAVIYGGMVGSGDTKGMTFEQIGDLVVDHGYSEVVRPVTRFLMLVISKDPSKVLTAEKQAEGPSEPDSSQKKA